jgi:hypothetical protein
MNKILIPIDLSKSSINQLDTFIQNAQEECVECLSMFSNFLTNSTTELLFNIETKSLYIKMPSNFKTKFEEFHDEHGITLCIDQESWRFSNNLEEKVPVWSQLVIKT